MLTLTRCSRAADAERFRRRLDLSSLDPEIPSQSRRMKVPQVVIVGRPNVGKSSIFNWLARRRLAIVDDTAGVTRDRMTYLMEVDGRFFELVDTGGMGIDDGDNLTEQIEEQISAAIESADVILFVVDTRSGLTPLDQEVAKRLRYLDKPILCVANKTDPELLDGQADEFYRLGRGKLIVSSVKANRKRELLEEMIVERLPPALEQREIVEPVMKVAIVGRRNVGKSTFVNTLAQAERMIVSEVPGTTRDSVDVRFRTRRQGVHRDRHAGLAQDARASRATSISTARTAPSGAFAGPTSCCCSSTPSQRISKVDKQLCDYIAEQYKPCIFVVNKWDLLPQADADRKWVNYLRDTFRTMWHVPIAFITGQTGKNVKALLNHAQMLFKQSLTRIATGQLNRLLAARWNTIRRRCIATVVPRSTTRPKSATQPPTIVLFCNEPKAFSPTYRRYLLGVFRDQLTFGEVPIKLYLKKRSGNEAPDRVHSAEEPEER